MDPLTKQYFLNMIKNNNVVHILADDGCVSYSLYDQQLCSKVLFLCSHAYNTEDQIFANYSICINSVPFATYTLPVLNLPNSKKEKPDIIQLMDTCAHKVIAQQKQIQKNSYLYLMANEKTVS